ncbi:nucleosidase [Bacteroides sp. 214]|uniref:5'-methylthioadenosine/S-adenosylhomocysteine nucleosidase family protein n=1 Tax=Bacteroides sp. 214 TaxID=2302935 RepID=UPI0013D01B37|nr:5'-methylthioadenosine/S-adenosylhomocysteine nucleosidase [Bacteroides sp. 214]NDW12559.1 nucleosidase [Bacteroides sp. 214]
MKTILITYAVREEFHPIAIEGFRIHYVLTGVGKAKSALRLTKAIIEHQPDAVINVGTAGTLSHRVGDIFVCTRFVDRDFQHTQLPGIEFELETEKHELFAEFFSGCQPGVCSTGDTFVTEASSFREDVVDMEAYAQALVCKEFERPFIAVKYVTDIIGQNSVKHWEDKLTDARKALTELLARR